jgi:DNA-binding transcriptional MocR family regulator
MLPVTQYVDRAGLIDLGWGHPAAWALPTEEWGGAVRAALARFGSAALTYGNPTGPGPLVEWLADRLGRIDGRRPGPEEVFVSAGASHALDLACAVLTRPGDVVLVDSPTYHLALRVIADHGVELVGAPADEDGIDPDRTAALLRRVQAGGRRAPMLYLVPTFANPTGDCLPDRRRAALVEVAARSGTVLVEDDTYRELAYDAPAPASLWSLAAGTGVLRIGSFSKTVAPGLRLGFLTGPRSFVQTLADRGAVDSGGGVNHTNAMAMTAFGESGGYDRHLARLLAGYRAQRDALVGALRELLAAADLRVPGGGWFGWLRLPDWAPAGRLLVHAERNGTSFLPGTAFYAPASTHWGTDHRPVADRRLRLSFSRHDPPLLVEATRRLALALDQVADTG